MVCYREGKYNKKTEQAVALLQWSEPQALNRDVAAKIRKDLLSQYPSQLAAVPGSNRSVDKRTSLFWDAGTEIQKEARAHQRRTSCGHRGLGLRSVAVASRCADRDETPSPVRTRSSGASRPALVRDGFLREALFPSETLRDAARTPRFP